MLNKILEEFVTSVDGAQAAIFMDGDGEAIAQAGETARDIRLLGAWKELHLGQIREITGRLGLGDVRAVLFSLDEGNELIAPVSGDYCLLLFLSSFSNLQNAMTNLEKAIVLLRKDIE